VKDEVYRVAARLGLPVVVVANSWIRSPERVTMAVAEGPDAAE
jgi:uncharacterized protein YaiI (UPF0178 family)